MDKVLLVTIYDYNLGNRLQNYALNNIIEQEGYEVINVIQPREKFTFNWKDPIKKTANVFSKLIGKGKRFKTVIDKEKEQNYIKFNQKYLNNTVKIEYDDYSNINTDKYIAAVTGSDQVWHKWDGLKEELEFFYLLFIEKDKRIAYAPSFGFSKFPKEDVEVHRKGLTEINDLSVREAKGSEIIKELVNRDAQVVLDPTLLISRSEWEKLSLKPNNTGNKDFLFIYFLGERTDDINKEFDRISKDKNLDIIDLSSEKYSNIGPSEFIWLISNASYVCTDSFHATVFSIIFEKLFTSFKRSGPGFEDMFDRIENLLNITKLNNRIFPLLDNEEKIEWENVKDLLEIEKEKSRKYLRESLKTKITD